MKKTPEEEEYEANVELVRAFNHHAVELRVDGKVERVFKQGERIRHLAWTNNTQADQLVELVRVGGERLLDFWVAPRAHQVWQAYDAEGVIIA